MSGPARPLAEADDPALDAGALGAGAICEWHGWRAVARLGGIAVLPWRSDHLAATAAGLVAIGNGADLTRGSFVQALVRIQKGRAATWSDLAQAWEAVRVGGRVLVTGGNDLGIATWVKRMAEVLGQPGEVLANHSRARVAAFMRTTAPERLAVPPDGQRVPLWPASWPHGDLPSGAAAARLRSAGGVPQIVVPPGVFSQGALDDGTALLLGHLVEEPAAAQVLDLGCGAGHLGLHTLLRWPHAHTWFVDADARAVAAVQRNLGAEGLGLGERGSVLWWDVSEPLPAVGFDLVLCNPPCHAGAGNDHTIALAMFDAAAAALAPGGRLLVVANRQLPYESALGAFGAVDIPVEREGFKILRLRRG
jgi:16S rRNA (guanine1207-N2)-methyltransferase